MHRLKEPDPEKGGVALSTRALAVQLILRDCPCSRQTLRHSGSQGTVPDHALIGCPGSLRPFSLQRSRVLSSSPTPVPFSPLPPPAGTAPRPNYFLLVQAANTFTNSNLVPCHNARRTNTDQACGDGSWSLCLAVSEQPCEVLRISLRALVNPTWLT